VLVAGGGTGDGTIYLAEQLRATNAEIIHLDLSEASIAIARKRADARRLNNIRWVHDSLLSLPGLGLGEFDYINCSGVLHHLADPNAGLEALLGARKASGALGVMVYGRYGRTGVYQMQSLLRMVSNDAATMGARLDDAKEILGCLPSSNWFQRGQDLYSDHMVFGDAGICDLLLHQQDCAYTVPELYAWFEDRHGLHLEFTDVGCGRASYLPQMVIGLSQPHFISRVSAKPLREQYAIAELLSGRLDMHSFYATASQVPVAPYGNPAMIPFFFHEPVSGPEISALIHRNQAAPLVINHSHTGLSSAIDPGKFGKFIMKYIDGKRTFGEIFALVKAEDKFRRSPPGDDELFADFKSLYDFFNAIDRLLLKRKCTE
jgi:SAM-dependent methyltransferase